jgi:hypothetical protein
MASSSFVGHVPCGFAGPLGFLCKEQITDNNSTQQNLYGKNPAVRKQDVATHPGRFVPGNFFVMTKTSRVINPLPDFPLNFLCIPIDCCSVGSSHLNSHL